MSAIYVRLWRGLWRIRIHRTIKLLTQLDKQFIDDPSNAILEISTDNAAIAILARLHEQLDAKKLR